MSATSNLKVRTHKQGAMFAWELYVSDGSDRIRHSVPIFKSAYEAAIAGRQARERLILKLKSRRPNRLRLAKS